jgi:hypothetical protein
VRTAAVTHILQLCCPLCIAFCSAARATSQGFVSVCDLTNTPSSFTVASHSRPHLQYQCCCHWCRLQGLGNSRRQTPAATPVAAAAAADALSTCCRRCWCCACTWLCCWGSGVDLKLGPLLLLPPHSCCGVAGRARCLPPVALLQPPMSCCRISSSGHSGTDRLVPHTLLHPPSRHCCCCCWHNNLAHDIASLALGQQGRKAC